MVKLHKMETMLISYNHGTAETVNKNRNKNSEQMFKMILTNVAFEGIITKEQMFTD